MIICKIQNAILVLALWIRIEDATVREESRRSGPYCTLYRCEYSVDLGPRVQVLLHRI
jgi:hypothetical protein